MDIQDILKQLEKPNASVGAEIFTYLEQNAKHWYVNNQFDLWNQLLEAVNKNSPDLLRDMEAYSTMWLDTHIPHEGKFKQFITMAVNVEFINGGASLRNVLNTRLLVDQTKTDAMTITWYPTLVRQETLTAMSMPQWRNWSPAKNLPSYTGPELYTPTRCGMDVGVSVESDCTLYCVGVIETREPIPTHTIGEFVLNELIQDPGTDWAYDDNLEDIRHTRLAEAFPVLLESLFSRVNNEDLDNVSVNVPQALFDTLVNTKHEEFARYCAAALSTDLLETDNGKLYVMPHTTQGSVLTHVVGVLVSGSKVAATVIEAPLMLNPESCIYQIWEYLRVFEDIEMPQDHPEPTTLLPLWSKRNLSGLTYQGKPLNHLMITPQKTKKTLN